MSVPRIIHQTWKTVDIPEQQRPWVERTKASNPGFEHRLWTDDDNRGLIADRFGWFLDTYDSYAHDIERADAARYFILLVHGGVYLDLDMEVMRPIEALVDRHEISFTLEAGPTLRDTVVSNAFMASPPGHLFFADLVHQLRDRRRRDVTFADVFANTGPDMLAERVGARWGELDIGIIGLHEVCPAGVLHQNVYVEPPRHLESVRERAALVAIHHNTELWNVQRPCPGQAPPGYVLFPGQDLPGHDRAYVEVPEDSFEPIIAACDTDPEAVGFNYNGFVKGAGGRLERAEDPSSWLKPGITPWVCVKEARVNEVR